MAYAASLLVILKFGQGEIKLKQAKHETRIESAFRRETFVSRVVMIEVKHEVSTTIIL